MNGRNHLLPSSLTRPITERHIIHHNHLEDRIAIQHRDIQSFLLDNQRLAATHLALKQDLSLAQQELRLLSAAAVNVKAERDAEVREVYERSLKMDAEARAVDARSAKLACVRADVQKFTVDCQELTAQLAAVNDELAKARTEAKQLPVFKTEMEAVRQEIHKGRTAIEREKKTSASNLGERQMLEKNLIIVAQEIEKLRAEYANTEKRAWAAAAAAANPNPTNNGNYGNIDDPKYGGSSLPDNRYSMPQAGAGPQFVPGSMSSAPLEGQGSHTPYENRTGSCLQFVPGTISDVPRENQ